VVVELGQGGGSVGRGKQRTAAGAASHIVFGVSGGAGSARRVSVECIVVQVSFVLVRAWTRGRLGCWRSLGGRRVNHEQETLLGGGELGYVVLRVGSADMLLHGAIPLFLFGERLSSASGACNAAVPCFPAPSRAAAATAVAVTAELGEERGMYDSSVVWRGRERERQDPGESERGGRSEWCRERRKSSRKEEGFEDSTYADAALAAAGAIGVAQRADDFIVGVGDGEGRG